MTHPILFTSDYTRPDRLSAFGRPVFKIKGLQNPDALFRLITIKPGLYMTVYNQPASRLRAMAYEVRNAPVSFSYILSGSCRHTLEGLGQSRDTEMCIGPGTNAVAALSGIRGSMTFDRESPMLCVDLKIDRSLLQTYLSGQMDSLAPALLDLFDPVKKVYLTSALDREMRTLAAEILTPPPFKGAALDLFFESRALNLLALQLDSMTQGRFPAQDPGSIDLDRIHHARGLLVADLKNPPTIAALARQCGINEFKLKKEFKQVFRTTIFAHLQQVKMEKAWHLLQQGRCSVTDAAAEVGYTNISHFSAAFRRQFSINPGVLKKNRSLAGLPLPNQPDAARPCHG